MNEDQWNKKLFLIKQIDQNIPQFKKIGKPENIYATGEEYDYIFFISAEFKQLSDVVDLQNLYLICDACKHCKIVALVSGAQSEYHKASHFFAFLTKDKGMMYENVFLNVMG